jgi:hypothetical protein
MAMGVSDSSSDIDWSLTIWEGAHREQLRRWAALPLENIIAALEEMETLAKQFAATRPRPESSSSLPRMLPTGLVP